MAVILNIETSSKFCSVSIGVEGMPVFERTDTKEMNHASALGVLAKECEEYAKRHELKPDAVAVSLGPGSYTGLRIGLSFAKGYAFSKSLPLIGIDTLKIIATKAMFCIHDWEGDELLVPMVDARRMEVYTTVLNSALEFKMPETAKILDENSFLDLKDERRVIFAGDGSGKFKPLYKGDNALWLEQLIPTAREMSALSEMAFRKNDFIDTAYSVPNYIKEFQATTPRNKIF